MRLLRKFVALVTCVLSFAYLILILNTIQMLSVVLYPFSHRAFRNVNRWCARSIWGLWVIMAERLARIEVTFVGDPVPPRENALLLPNHQTMADVMVLLCFAWRCGRIGDIKWFVKDAMKWVPGVGWGMKFLDCVFVRRDWVTDKKSIERLFSKYRRHRIPVFLVSFLEGTRKTDAKLLRAQDFARERGQYVPEHTLVPRTKGFVASMAGLRDHLDAVYDITIGYPERIPSLRDCFACNVERIEVRIRRFPIADLPTSDEELAAWVFERYRIKDEEMAGFIQPPQRFEGEQQFGEIRALDWLVPEKRRAEG